MRYGWNWKYPLSNMYPAYTQLVAKCSSPSIGDRRATGCSPKCTSSRSHLTMWPNTRSSLTLSTWYKPSLKADILQRRRTGWDGVPCTLIAAGGEVKWFGRFGIRWPADFVRSHLGLPTNEQSWKQWWEQKKVINQQIIFHETKEWQEMGSSSTPSNQNAKKWT